MFKHIDRLSLKPFLLTIGASLIASMFGYCQHVSSKNRFVFDHEAYVTNTLVLGPQEMTAGLVGDYINLDTGELSFRQRDIEIKGNFDIPVSVIRYIDSDNDRPTFTYSEVTSASTGTANWGLELPYILLHTIKKGGTVGCIASGHSVDMFDKLHVVPRLSIGRNKRWTLLKTAKSSNKVVFGDTPPSYTTSSMWLINQTKTGGKCSWKAKAPNGKTYEFGQPFILEKRYDGAKKHAVLITKITDVHGNWVAYSYDKKHKRLKSITSSDDRKIQFVYRANHELEGFTANGRKWTYTYKKMSTMSKSKYLYRVTLPDGRYSEFGKLLGVNSYSSSFHAQRCNFGYGARIKHYTGVVATYKTQKIVNFAAVTSPNGHLHNSHRAECLPPTAMYDLDLDADETYQQILNSNSPMTGYAADQYKWGKISSAMNSASLKDGKSKHGNFSTHFTSAVTEKKLESPDGKTIIWTYSYDEGDLFNGDYSEKTSIESVHKDGKLVEVNVSKPKKRTVTGPLGNKYEFHFGRGLHDTGALITESIFPKGSKVASRTIQYEYLHSANKLGTAWDCSKPMPKPTPKPMTNHAVNQNLNQSSTEKWRRVSKRTMTQDSEVYTTSNEYDDRGSLTKSTKSSTVQTETEVMNRKVSHLTSKWILDLTASITVNGKETRGFTRDANGKVTLETRNGSQYQRKSWYSDGSLAAVRDGNNDTTKFENYKRGIAQKTTKPSGATLKKVVDENGWVTSKTDALGYKEAYTLDKAGRVTRIDRPAGYADSTITYTLASSTSGRIKTVTTGTGTQKLIEKTTYNIFGDEILEETRDVSNNTSVFIRSAFDKLGRKIFESIPSSVSAATAGINASFDSLGRVTQLKLSVSPFSKVSISYLSDNRISVTDVNGNVTVTRRSGFASPVDGKIVQIKYPDGAKTLVSHDSWQNVTSVQLQANGKTLQRSYKYDSRLQLCFQSIPESGTEAFTYDATRRRITSEKEVSATYVCQSPVTVNINNLPKPTVPSSPKKPTSKPTTPAPQTPKSCSPYMYMVWVPSYNKCMNIGIVYQCGDWILTSQTKNGCIYDPECAINHSSVPNVSFSGNNSSIYYNFNKVLTIHKNRPWCTKFSVYNSAPESDSVSTNIIQYAYNSDGLLTSIDYPDGTPDISYTFDLGGNLTKSVSGSVVLAYTYGKRGELKSETLTVDNETYSATYVYDSTGGRISYNTPGGKEVKFTLNAFNQVTAIKIGTLKYISDAIYHPNGVLKGAKLHNTKTAYNSATVTLSQTLNSLSLVSKTSLAGNSDILSFSKTYFNDGRLNTVVDTLNVSSGVGNRKYTYSVRGFVTSVEGRPGVTNYSHDKFSNLLSHVHTSESVVLKIDRTSNQVNSFTRTNDDGGPATITVSHDGRGRTTQFGNITISYDHADRLISAIETGRFEDQSYYDGNHNRAKFVEKSLTGEPNQKRHLFYSVEGPLLSQIAIPSSSFSDKVYSDLINFGSNLTLHIYSCAHWIYHSNTNNTIYALKPDNSISTTTSIGPFGSSWGSSDEEANPCEESQSAASASSSNDNSEDSQILNNQLFRNVARDKHTKFFFLGSKRFYEAFGRYLTPDSTLDWADHAKVNIERTNLYSIANNDPINVATQGFAELNEHFARLNRSSIVPYAHVFEEYYED